jgi:hypothetical protein
MKHLQIIAWLIFIIGLFLRLLHFPFAIVISIYGALLLVILLIVYLIKNAKSNISASFFYLSHSLITVYILFRLNYWYCGPKIFGISLLFVIVSLVNISYFVLIKKSKTKFQFPQLLLVVYFAFFLCLVFYPFRQNSLFL